ncbi:MAG: hypothetical protein ACLSUW_08410 [Akkermansia sp.]
MVLLVPTQVVDLVRLGLRAPSTAGCVSQAAARWTRNGRKARTLGWPIVRTTAWEAGSQLATAFPGDSFLTDRLSLLPHWEVQTDKGGLLRFQGRQIVRPPADADAWRIPSGKSGSRRSGGNFDLVRLEGVC